MGPELHTHIGGTPPTEADLSALYARQVVGFSPDGTQEWMNWIVLVDGSTPAGYVQAGREVGSATVDIAWVIGAEWQRNGYATTAVELMLAELASRGVTEVVADIHPDNKPSEGVAHRVGMGATDVVVDGETRWAGTAPATVGAGARGTSVPARHGSPRGQTNFFTRSSMGTLGKRVSSMSPMSILT